MQVTLKKALKLAEALGKAAKPLKTEITFDRFSDAPVVELFQTENQQLHDQLKVNLALVRAQYQLRAIIGAANATAVDGLLNQRAMLEAELKLLRAVPLRTTPFDAEAVAARRVATRVAKDNSFSAFDSEQEHTLAAPEDVEPAIKRRELERTKLEDQLAEANFTTKITVPPEVEALLAQHGLI